MFGDLNYVDTGASAAAKSSPRFSNRPVCRSTLMSLSA